MFQARPTVLVVDDDPGLLAVVAALLEQHGIHALRASSAAHALATLRDPTRHVDTVICDLRMPGRDGLELLDDLRRLDRRLPVILLTAHGSVKIAVQAMQRGASDFVLKPFEREQLLAVVRKALASSERARIESPALRSATGCAELLGDSAAMRATKDLIGRAARGTSTVLLRGETGTGKELAARALHELSPRAAGPFVTIHCAALPDSLLESELFGHEAGAFTGAVQRKPGRVELAQGGTLLLDEIGDVTPVVQVKLLRLLQEREFTRLGGTAPLVADVRFVAATHRDLEAMVAAGQLREDLFYRLNVVPIWLPPLRGRGDDVAMLTRHFATDAVRDNGLGRRSLGDDAIALLAAQPWPGNVRQLKNFVERLLVLCPGDRVRADDVAAELERPSASQAASEGSHRAVLSLARTCRLAEREAVVTALRQSQGNRSQAARILGISRRTLYKKLARQGLG